MKHIFRISYSVTSKWLHKYNPHYNVYKQQQLGNSGLARMNESADD